MVTEDLKASGIVAQEAAAAATQKILVEAARREYGSDDIEIDDDAKLSRAPEDGGTWVAAWVWVRDAEEFPTS